MDVPEATRTTPWTASGTEKAESSTRRPSKWRWDWRREAQS